MCGTCNWSGCLFKEQVSLQASVFGCSAAFSHIRLKNSAHLLQSTKMMDEFMQMAKANTLRNLETCGVLAGSLVSKILLPGVSFQLLKCDQIPLMNIKHPAVKFFLKKFCIFSDETIADMQPISVKLVGSHGSSVVHAGLCNDI